MTATYSSPEAKRFFTWFDTVTDKASRSAVGKILTAQGWAVQHTGGGCLAWDKTNGKYFVWITSDGTDLGERVRKPEKAVWCLGLYSMRDNAWLNPPSVTGLAAAIKWCDEALANQNATLAEAYTNLEANNCDGWTIADLDPSDLADRFANVLRKWLSQREFAEMKHRNETDPVFSEEGGACASQSYCDANMAMDAAVREIIADADIDADDEAQTAVWNEAWTLARKRHLGWQG